jgi:HEAT repeat protein
MRAVVSLLSLFWFFVGTMAPAQVRTDFAMDSDPDMKLPVRKRVFVKDYKPLWSEALKRPEADIQRRTADSIAEASRMGMRGLEWAQPGLVAIVSADATHPSARFAAARTLIALEAKTTAPLLWEASKRSGDLRQLIEPALASWQFQPMADVWGKRLPIRETRHRDLLLAIRGVEAIGDESAVPALLAIVEDPFRAGETRLAAARSAGRLQRTGLESRARQLVSIEKAPILVRLCAVSLLQRHEGEAAEQILVALARDTEPSVAAEALTRLNAIDADLAGPLAEEAMKNLDPLVRRQGAEAYVLRPTPERIPALARLLDDPHPAVRGRVCEALFQLAKSAELDETIRREATSMLAADGWRGQEQAALLLGALDHKAAAPRLVALLESTRAEVMAATAWGLRKLAVAETLPALLDKATRQTQMHSARTALTGTDSQVGHLFEAFGLMKHAAAAPLMTKYIADKGFGEMSRGAAIWALGHLHASSTDEELERAFVGRITESLEIRPLELDRVRYMSAVSLVRMKAKSSVPAMRGVLMTLGPSAALPPAIAARWTIKQLTGEAVADPDPFLLITDWFLEPLSSTSAESR